MNEPKNFLEAAKMIPVDTAAIRVDTIDAAWLTANAIALDVLRLDLIHPVISGNKWFKLKYFLQDAQQNNATNIATFGGAWSNHIAATAFACKALGLKSIGVIRGEEPAKLSATLEQASANGMQLVFVSRENYRAKTAIMQADPGWYWVPEGGFGRIGVAGAKEILSGVDDLQSYSHIVAAVGTGTMLAGLINSALPHQHIIGISSMKGNDELNKTVQSLTIGSASFEINHDFHFGGYGKHPKQLIDFINEVYQQHQLPLDIVYTGKTFFAIKSLVEEKRFPRRSKILMIHSGGLQGNNSLPAELLAF
jgi:1-aminocyclopropane-1-carboxylate deaminase